MRGLLTIGSGFVFSAIQLFSFGAYADLASGSCASPDGNRSGTRVVTSHSVTIDGKPVSYAATAGFTEVTGPDGKSKACIFFTAYTVAPANGAKPRPVVFAFNGGPGSPSVWVHIGLLGPKRVDTGPDGLDFHVPGRLIENESSLIDVSDIVIFDPVATGYSAPEGDAGVGQFFGVKNDYKAAAEFIRSYVTEFSRWSSPKFILGESYGGMRASLLAHHLQADFGIGVNGAILISPWLSTELTDFQSDDNELPYIYYLPSFAASAWYHQKRSAADEGKSIAQIYREALQFAEGDYLDGLFKGNDIDAGSFHELAKRVADLTGVAQETVEESNLRLSDSGFASGIFAKERRVTGFYDARLTGPRVPSDSTGNFVDPSDMATNTPYIETINSYLRGELGLNVQAPYQPQADTGTESSNWPYDADGHEFNVIEDLNRALAINPSFKLFVASGYYDLVCPAGTVQYALSRLAPGLGVEARVHQSFFEGGHMMYTNPRALAQLKTELAAFIAGAVSVAKP